MDVNALLEEVRTEYYNITIEEKEKLLRWSLMNNRKEFYDILLNDPFLFSKQTDILKNILSHFKCDAIYNMINHKSFMVLLNMSYYVSFLKCSYNRHSKLYNYVIDNVDNIFDNISISLVEDMVRKFDGDAVSMCYRSNILCDRIMKVDPTLLTKMKNIMIIDRKKKLKKIKKRINEKQEA